MNNPLYNLTNQYLALQDLDMPAEDLADSLEGIEGEINIKAENIIHVLANMDTTAIDAEIKRLQTLKRSITSRRESLNEYLRFNMMVCDITNIKWDTGSVTLCKPSQVVQIDDEDSIPARFNKVTTAANKALIKKALKDGEDVPGCKLVDAKHRLLIK